MAGNFWRTTVNDLPDEILSNIISAVSDTRSRNATALVCHKWRRVERKTRTDLVLRGNIRDLDRVPTCFGSVSHLDLTLLSPWGYPLSNLAQYLCLAFPSVTSLSVYLRTPSTLELLAPHWPQLSEVKLVRFHQRPQLQPGADFSPLLEHCHSITSLDLSSFYCWNEDIPPALESSKTLAENLTRLNLLNPSFAEGFKSDQIRLITSLCPNLKQFLVACMFDRRYIGFVDDETLVALSSNCPKLSLLHLVDISALLYPRGNPDDEGFTAEDAMIGAAAWVDMFSSLPLLEELVLDVCSNVRESRVILELLNSKCPKLKSLKLGQFHGLCKANDPNQGSKLDGLALCQSLEELSIKNSADLTDFGLVAVAKGCSRLAKFEVDGCRRITVNGMRLFASLLHRTLVDVKISSCKNLGAVSSLKALEPIEDRIRRLHIDCVWDSVEQVEALEGIEYNFDLNKTEECGIMDQNSGFGFENYLDIGRIKKKSRNSYDLNGSCHEGNGNGNGYERTWERLQYLSLWIGVGELLTPLVSAGLENCPNLEEIQIKVEGDTRDWSRPSERAFGLSSLNCYPFLKKMRLDCRDTIGYAHTAPSGQADLSLWERFYLNGIGCLFSLNELDYWPPQDRDVNQRSLSLPAVGLLGECTTLRKLFIHGTAHEHFMMELLRIPKEYIRDVQLREDYYPAPENDMNTEMRVSSYSRFETALNGRQILD